LTFTQKCLGEFLTPRLKAAKRCRVSKIFFAPLRLGVRNSSRMIAPFQCIRCNAVLVVVDAPTVVCRYCGGINEVPAAYREELRLARDLDETTRCAIAEWARLDQIKVPRWLFIGAASLPVLVIAGGLAILLSLGMLKTVSSTSLPQFLAVFVWLPLVPAALLASRVGMRNLLVSGATRIGVAFAATPSATESGGLNCRQCGAPLAIEAGDILVRCLYCGAESIVRLDAAQMRSLETNVGTAKMSLAQAMAALSKHAELASFETRGRVLVIAGLLVLPLLWSFSLAVQSSYWTFVIALDVFVLGLCVFWMMREAFLPPVTVAELDSLRATEAHPKNDTPKRPAGTRGWYDHANEPVNFLIPLVVSLMFVAIEAIVFTAR
jgi:DNA-directed RNA polymerase subunit RPC12/RpoP